MHFTHLCTDKEREREREREGEGEGGERERERKITHIPSLCVCRAIRLRVVEEG